MKNKRREFMAAVDWSELPMELLNLISQRFHIELDLLRFRSVCSTWRSSSIPNHFHILPFKYPYSKNNNKRGTSSSRHISKQNIYLIKPSPQQQQQHDQTLLRPWLIRTSQTSHDKTKLFHPLLTNIKFRAISFTQLLDSNKFSILQLRTNFIINTPRLLPEKLVAVTCHGKKPLVLGTWTSIRPPPLNCGNADENVNWKAIPGISIRYGDLCLYNGGAYAVDKTGRTVMVRAEEDNSNVQLVAEPLINGGGHIKFLVENEGGLLLVDVYDCNPAYYDPSYDSLRIDLFKLNEMEKKWVKFTGLGDRVLFLGLVCSFSASASDLCVPEGNCVIFMDNIFRYCLYFRHVSHIFHLDQARLSPLSDYPEYFNLFSPPEWIVKSC